MFTVFWDNDGVLVETEGLYFRATRTVLETIGVELTLEDFQEVSLRRGESAFLVAADRGIEVERIAALRAERNRLYAELLGASSCVVEGAEETLRALDGKVRMVVVTSSRRDHFEIAHARSGLLRFFDGVLTREDYEHSKPHPEPYLTALERYRLRPDGCIVVEDSERGLAAAVAAGLECLVVRSEWTCQGDFSRALKVLPDISAVPGAVLDRAARWRAASGESFPSR